MEKSDIGSKENPIHNKTDININTLNVLWTVATCVAIKYGMEYGFQYWNTDPETKALEKKEREIEVQIKNHPDYISIKLQQEKNDATEKANIHKEKQLQLTERRAKMVQYHNQEIDRYIKCDSFYTEEFCSDMKKFHLNMLKDLANR